MIKGTAAGLLVAGLVAAIIACIAGVIVLAQGWLDCSWAWLCGAA